MKKVLAILLALVMVFTLVACGKDKPVAADKDYTIRIYSNSNSTERQQWLVAEAAKAGFKISLDNNEVINGDTAAGLPKLAVSSMMEKHMVL